MNQAQSKNLGTELLEFQRKLELCKSLRELNFVSVNDTFTVLNYDQAVMCVNAGTKGASVAE